MTPEGKVKKKVRELFKQFSAWYFAPVSNGMGKHGVPDYIACLPVTITPDMVGETVGLFVAVETKRDDVTTVTARQEGQIRQIRASGGVAIVVNMERIPKFKQALIRLTRGG